MGKIISFQPPAVQQRRISWHASRLLLPQLRFLNLVGGWLTLWDFFGTPGDSLLTAALARIIRHRYPKLKINCITPNPEILRHDPNIDLINSQPGLIVLRFWYLEIIYQKDGNTNLLAPTLKQIGIYDYDYHARVFLAPEEVEWARDQLRKLDLRRPLITINVQSREKVKVWPVEKWKTLIHKLALQYNIIQLGASDEPEFAGVTRFAGSLTFRETMAILSQVCLHIGGVSFLMHAANGLDIPSVIIYGGRETPKNSGYSTNANLYAPMPCGPCWLHDSRGDVCPDGIACMEKISAEEVESAVREMLARSSKFKIRLSASKESAV